MCVIPLRKSLSYDNESFWAAASQNLTPSTHYGSLQLIPTARWVSCNFTSCHIAFHCFSKGETSHTVLKKGEDEKKK